jgi:hypothetical protein
MTDSDRKAMQGATIVGPQHRGFSSVFTGASTRARCSGAYHKRSR